MDYKEIFDTLTDYDKKFTLVHGFIDIVELNSYRCVHKKSYNRDLVNPLARDFTNSDFWILSGRGTTDIIIEDIYEYDFPVDKEGEYEFKALLKYNPDDYQDYIRGYYEIVYLETNFIHTFEARDREYKLNQILPDDFENLFNL